MLDLTDNSEGNLMPAAPGTGHVGERGARIFHGEVVAHREGADSGGVFFADPDGIRLEVFAPDAGAGPFGSAPTCGFF